MVFYSKIKELLFTVLGWRCFKELKWACSRNLLPVVLESCLAWALILSPYRYTYCVYVSGFWKLSQGKYSQLFKYM
jgi:hypothetical protein